MAARGCGASGAVQQLWLATSKRAASVGSTAATAAKASDRISSREARALARAVF